MLTPMQRKQISVAVELLRQGKVIAFPTDTVYGIGGDPNNEQAILSVFNIKGRSFKQGLPVLLPNIEHMYEWIDNDSLDKYKSRSSQLFNLLEDFWPGPLTVVFKKAKHVSHLLTANQNTIALRVPNHPVALHLLKEFNNGIIGTSANKSGEASTIDYKEVKKAFGHELFVLDEMLDESKSNDDYNDYSIGVESTIISFIDNKISLLRQGAISFKDITCYFSLEDLENF